MTEPMTGVNSPFTQKELDDALALIVEAGLSKEWAEDFLARSWSKVGVHPASAASGIAGAMRAKRRQPRA